MPVYRRKISGDAWAHVGSGSSPAPSSHARNVPEHEPTFGSGWKKCPECPGVMRAVSGRPRCHACQYRLDRVAAKKASGQMSQKELLRRFLATPAKLLAKGKLAELTPLEKAILAYERESRAEAS